MIKIGIIGLGNVGLSVHLPILLARSDLKISWVYDPNIKVKKICDKKKIPFFYLGPKNNWKKILDKETINIINKNCLEELKDLNYEI